MNEQKGSPRNLSTGPKGGRFTRPCGGLSPSTGDGAPKGPSDCLSSGLTPCYLTIPPWHVFFQELGKRSMKNYADRIRQKRPDVQWRA